MCCGSCSSANNRTVQYLRYAALGLGVGYGAYRSASLNSFVAARELQAKDRAHDLLVEEGRVAYEASLAREEAIQGAKAGIVVWLLLPLFTPYIDRLGLVPLRL